MTGVITSIPPLVELPPGNSSSNPAGLPGVTYTAAIPVLAQTWSGLQTFKNGAIQFAGSTSGNTFLNATSIASGVLTLPSATDTLVARNTVDTLTNKTLTSPIITGATISGSSVAIHSSGTGNFDLSLLNAENLTANRSLTIAVNDANRVFSLGGNLSTAGAVSVAGAFAATLNVTAATTVTFPTSGTLATLANAETFTNKTLTSPSITTPTGIVKSDVGLGNVDNTSDATKNSAIVALTNKTLTSPVINTPTGIVKGDVGLGNVDNTSDITKNAAVATLTNKTLTSPVINTPTGIAKGDVGLGNVDNTSDANKPVSTAQATAIALKANATTAAIVPLITATGAMPGGLLQGDGSKITIVPGADIAPAKVMLDGAPIAFGASHIQNVDGTISSPRTTTSYKTPVLYIERHTNSATANSCDWGNGKKNAAATVEVVAYGSETGEVNAFAGRVFSATAAPAGAQGLIGISTLAQSNAPAGQNNRDVWAANLVAASSSGNKPVNIVGIEVDIIPSQSASSLRPGQTGADNFTAFWAQTDGGSISANTAYYASENGTGGWQYGSVMDCHFQSYIAYWRTQVNAPGAKGLRIEAQYGAAAGRVVEVFIGASQEQFRVDGASDNPVWIRVGSALKNVLEGAADSAGTGFKYLKVAN